MKSSNPHHLLIGMLLGIVLGILLGGFAPSMGLSIAFIGDLFLQALFALVVPLVMSSMIVGIASLGDVRKLGSIGLRDGFIFYDDNRTGSLGRPHFSRLDSPRNTNRKPQP